MARLTKSRAVPNGVDALLYRTQLTSPSHQYEGRRSTRVSMAVYPLSAAMLIWLAGAGANAAWSYSVNRSPSAKRCLEGANNKREQHDAF